uniref:Cystinosin n=1 Tax=Ditylum brightwellii TaxID=49249 RepID=A0A7S4REA9_9STRA
MDNQKQDTTTEETTLTEEVTMPAMASPSSNNSTTPLLQEMSNAKQSTTNTQNTSSAVSCSTASIARSTTSRNNNNNNNNNEHKSTSPLLSNLKKACTNLFAPFTDSTGSPTTILPGLFLIICIGTVLGVSLPKESSLPTPWYRTFSSIIGYVYFTAWSISFYPQIFMNYRRKRTVGLSVDFSAMNVLGFACYAVYNASLFWSPYIQNLYRQNHAAGESIPVRSNDVAFALHAFVLSSITLGQIWYYDGFGTSQTKMSFSVKLFFGVAFLVLVFSTLVAIVSSKLSWLGFLYILSYVKVVITLLKYIPQVVLNVRRKSTVGWNIWNIILDFTGGMLSLAQLLGDSADMHDWSGITGNFAKFCLGFVSIFFDIIFFFQHYVLYPDKRGEGNESTHQAGLEPQIPWEEEADYDYDALL